MSKNDWLLYLSTVQRVGDGVDLFCSVASTCRHTRTEAELRRKQKYLAGGERQN